MDYQEIHQSVQFLADSTRAPILQRFFKTGKGEYAEGDVFLGLTVPQVRAIAQEIYLQIDYANILLCLQSPIHEERLLALCILVLRFKKIPTEKEIIFQFYIKHQLNINNWDLVDTSAKDIVGAYLFDKPKHILYEYAQDKNVWTRRISIIATFYFIGKGQFDDTIAIAKILLKDKHDLIHKAVGWMLREMGKKNKKLLLDFLDQFYLQMPRTMLRYAIEKLDVQEKAYYMKK